MYSAGEGGYWSVSREVVGRRADHVSKRHQPVLVKDVDEGDDARPDGDGDPFLGQVLVIENLDVREEFLDAFGVFQAVRLFR